MKISLLTFLLLIFGVWGCASIIKRIDKQENNFLLKPQAIDSFCSNEKNFDYIIYSDSSTYHRLLLNSIQNFRLSEIEAFVFISLYQMYLRPDLASPTANLFFYEKNKDHSRIFYFDQQSGYNFSTALEYLLTEAKSRYRLKDILALVDKTLPSMVEVETGLQEFIIQNKAKLLADPQQKALYFRVDEPLRQGEKFKRLSLTSLFSQKSDLRDISPLTLSTPIKTSKGEFACSFSFAEYEDSAFKSLRKPPSGLRFGLASKEKTFMAVTETFYQDLKFHQGTGYPINEASKNQVQICEFVNQEQKLTLISHQSPDSAQHLYNLFKFDLDQLQNIYQVNQLVQYARYIFLTDPIRMVYEAQRGSEKQLAELLKLNIPIYHANQLGHITALYFNQRSRNIVIDNRHQGELTCR